MNFASFVIVAMSIVIGYSFGSGAGIVGQLSQLPESATLVLSGIVMFVLARSARHILSVAKAREPKRVGTASAPYRTRVSRHLPAVSN